MEKTDAQMTTMTQEELRSYRLTSMEEPTDEMLQAIMKQVAESARHVPPPSSRPNCIGGLRLYVRPKSVIYGAGDNAKGFEFGDD